MIRTTFRKKSTAKAYRGTGRRVYKVKNGYRVSPECPRSRGKRGALIQIRTKNRRRARPKSFLAAVMDALPF